MNGFRAATGRTGRYGYAAVSFGDPVSLSSWLAALGEDVFALPIEPRRAHIRGYADILMSEIARRIPATPATTVADAALSGPMPVSRRELRERVAALLATMRKSGRFLAQGREYAHVRAGWERLHEAPEDRRSDLLSEETGMVAADEAELTLRLGLEFLIRRGALRLMDRTDESPVLVTDADIVLYYARSLDRSL